MVEKVLPKGYRWIGVSYTPTDRDTNLYWQRKDGKNPRFQIVVLEESKHE